MNKIVTTIIVVVFAAALSGWMWWHWRTPATEPAVEAVISETEQNKEESEATMTATTTDDKILLVYFSRTNNTDEVAQFLQTLVPTANVLRLEVAEPYPESYQETLTRVQAEIAEGARPALTNLPTEIDEYQTIILGSPIWYGSISLPVMTFLDNFDWNGKTILPFITHGGGGAGTSMTALAEAAVGATIGEPLVIADTDLESIPTVAPIWLEATGLTTVTTNVDEF